MFCEFYRGRIWNGTLGERSLGGSAGAGAGGWRGESWLLKWLCVGSKIQSLV